MSTELSSTTREHEETIKSVVDRVMKNCAQHLLQHAIELEAAHFIEEHSERLDATGRRQVVRHGYMPPRQVKTHVGVLTLRQPRVKDRGRQVVFASTILRRYARRIFSPGTQFPLLFLEGNTQWNVLRALHSMLGSRMDYMNQTLLTRLTEGWRVEMHKWRTRDLSKKHYTELWAGVVTVGDDVGSNGTSMLVLVGRIENGGYEMLATIEGSSESRPAWRSLIRDVYERGLREAPEVAIGDRRLGWWKVLSQVFPSTVHDRR